MATDKIYVGQTALTLRLNTGIDLSTAISAVIKYINSDKEELEWDAVIDTPATDGTISYEIESADDLNKCGNWKMWSYVTFSGGTVAPGDTVEFTVYKEGS